MYTTSYRTLCLEAEASGHIVKLSRFDGGDWGLQLLVAPQGAATQWRAGGFAFFELEELDRHAAHLLAWLRVQDHRRRDRVRQNEGEHT